MPDRCGIVSHHLFNACPPSVGPYKQYVLQEIAALGKKVYYHTRERAILELDFVIQKYNVYPIEVKAEENLKSKSLKTICDGNKELNR
ncbi:MAG: DUF4143 domain-containing protein [Lachnospiraceae bacterium]|nr:DUF4143 domain-containing protein [Lachnospiraceae bacterium]